MTKEEMLALFTIMAETRNKMIGAVKDCLATIGHAVEFDWRGGYAPSYSSNQFDEDLTDAFISKIWLEDNLVKVNAHAYYLNRDCENIDLNDESCANYEDILSYLIEKFED